MLSRLGLEAGMIAFGSYGVAGCVRRYIEGEDGWLYPCGMFVIVIAFSFYAVSRNWVRYKFDRGSVTALRGAKVLWHEDLTGLQYVLYTNGRWNDLITLHWPNRKRRIELYSSLQQALNSHAENPDAPS
jgi:hypothetical protein